MSLYLGNNLISGTQIVTDKSERIGQIIPSTIPLTDAGLHLLDGALISGSGSYSAFVDYIAGLVTDYPDLFETEANWQQSVTDYGVCGKFVYDSINNTVRLPKITGIIEGTTDLTALGDLVQAGLPNITGVAGTFQTLAFSDCTGAFKGVTPTGTGTTATTGTGSYSLAFDASRSSSIYGNSTTVQPQTIKVLYYIVIATSIKTDIQVDIDEIATDLNGKADTDLSNLTSTSSTNFDGQWVYSYLPILSNGSSNGNTNASYSLANYLPNDNYTYEVMFSFYGSTSSSTSGGIYFWVGSDITNGSSEGSAGKFTVARVRSQASSAQYAGAQFILPIGIGRTLYTRFSNEASVSGLYLNAIMYRRIGTNS